MERGQFALDEIRREIGVANASRIVVAQLDLESTMNIRKFAREFLSLEKRLDILVNNAGVMNVPQGWTLDGFEVTFGIFMVETALLGDRIQKQIIQTIARFYFAI